MLGAVVADEAVNFAVPGRPRLIGSSQGCADSCCCRRLVCFGNTTRAVFDFGSGSGQGLFSAFHFRTRDEAVLEKCLRLSILLFQLLHFGLVESRKIRESVLVIDSSVSGRGA